jgi:hypothetical protein
MFARWRRTLGGRIGLDDERYERRVGDVWMYTIGMNCVSSIFIIIDLLFGLIFSITFRFVGFDAGRPLVRDTSFWGFRSITQKLRQFICIQLYGLLAPRDPASWLASRNLESCL